MNEKQEFERRCVQLLLTVTGMYDPRSVHAADRPDVRIDTDRGEIGVEVTRVFSDSGPSGSAAAEQKGLLEIIRDEARALHAQETNQNLNVWISPTYHCRIARHRCNFIAKQLVTLLVKHTLGVHESVRCGTPERYEPLLPPEISSLRAIRLPGTDGPIWLLSDAFWVGTTSQTLIQRILDEKESKLRGYDRTTLENWILLVCDGSAETSALQIHDTIDSEVYTTSFDRAYVLDHLASRFAKLVLTAGSS